MARSKTSKAWMHEHVTDRYVRQAKHEGYRSRAAYKLQELARQDRLIQPGMMVVDLGAAPGGWSQVAAELVGPKGRVIAVDILDMAPDPGSAFIQGDLREEAHARPSGKRPAGTAGRPCDERHGAQYQRHRHGGPGARRAPGRAGAGVCPQVAETGRKPPGQSVPGRRLTTSCERRCSRISGRSSPASHRPRAAAAAKIYLLGQGLDRSRLTAILPGALQ